MLGSEEKLAYDASWYTYHCTGTVLGFALKSFYNADSDNIVDVNNESFACLHMLWRLHVCTDNSQ